MQVTPPNDKINNTVFHLQIYAKSLHPNSHIFLAQTKCYKNRLCEHCIERFNLLKLLMVWSYNGSVIVSWKFYGAASYSSGEKAPV